ncbi:MAG: serine hydrolase [Crocinitomicaceae bacterium]
MKVRSIIWAYLLISILYFVPTDDSDKNAAIEGISEADKMGFAIDSVYKKLSLDSKLKLLTINNLDYSTSSKDSIKNLPYSNGILSTDLNEINRYNENFSDTSNGFENLQLTIFSGNLVDSLLPQNIAIGQTGLPKLASFSMAIKLEKVKTGGANVFLGSEFQSYQWKRNNADKSYTESPLNSEQFWQATLEGAEKNGVKLGLNDPFSLYTHLDSTEEREFKAIGLAGNRYYARRGHGIVQLTDSVELFHHRYSNHSDKKTRQSFLRNEFKFNGVIISQNLSSLPPDLQIEKAYQSILNGSDIVCINPIISHGLHQKLKDYFQNEGEELKNHVYRILRLKYELFQTKNDRTHYDKFKKQFAYQVRSAGIACLNNEQLLLPIKNLNTKFYFYSPDKSSVLEKEMNHYVLPKPVDNSAGRGSICLVDGFSNHLEQALKWSKSESAHHLKLILVTDQLTLYRYRQQNLNSFDGIIVTADSSEMSQKIAIQTIFGANEANGKLPFYLSPQYPMNAGFLIPNLHRMAYAEPEWIGVSSEKLASIDKIVEAGREAKAFPGCQVLVGLEGKVIYQKSFGYKDYSEDSPVDNQTIYDIASITKIAASTVSLMKLQSEGLFSLNKTLGDYIPELVGNTEFENINLRDMMAHQAGLPAWIPFYSKTLTNGQLNPYFYSSTKKPNYTVPVAKDLWIRNNYPDTIYDRILSSKLGGKSYLYSDLGYYFVKKIIEKLTKTPLDKFVRDSIYDDLDLQYMTYNPYLKYNLAQIAPTENDKAFRKQVIHGYVHDPGAAMLGGVGGHAGIFSTANDLAILMQMMLNEGMYGGKQILKKEVLEEYTRAQFPDNNNRRGAGFDKPNLNGSAATACSLASPSSFGHSGFTGTLTWADPKYNLNFVFLSNRVYPSAENWKIVNMNIRTDIQTRIYQAITSAEHFNFLQ